jgi:hypothetical protein
MKKHCLILSILIIFPFSISASETEGSEKHDEEAHHKHTIGLFLGVTREHSENLETFGLEYSYRFHPKWTVGGVIERADREKDSTLGIVFVHFWPHKGLFLGGGVGRKDPGDKRENTARATIGYEWELPRAWIINLQANVDFIEHEDREEVYGVAIGKSF